MTATWVRLGLRVLAAWVAAIASILLAARAGKSADDRRHAVIRLVVGAAESFCYWTAFLNVAVSRSSVRDAVSLIAP